MTRHLPGFVAGLRKCGEHGIEPYLTGIGYVCPKCEGDTAPKWQSKAEERARAAWNAEQDRKHGKTLKDSGGEGLPP